MWRHGSTFSTLLTGGGLTFGSVYLTAPHELSAGILAATLLGAAGMQVYDTTVIAFSREIRWRSPVSPILFFLLGGLLAI